MNRVEQLEAATREAMHCLENISCGGVGAGGHTLAELNAIGEAENVAEDNADYHTAQTAWRILETALKKGREG